MKITSDFLDKGKSSNNGWNTAQIGLLGESMKVHGWRRRLIGKEISEETATKFLALKDSHLSAPKLIVLKKKDKFAFEPITVDLKWKEQYLHPNWQRMRLLILKRDNFTCIECRSKDKTLHVHHIKYLSGKYIWEVPLYYLVTLCEDCHSKEHDRDLRAK